MKSRCLWLVIAGVLSFLAVTSQADTVSAAPAIASPPPGSTVLSTVTFTGDHTPADVQHWIYVGTTQGAFNLFSQNLGTGHTVTVSGLPTSGTIWVRYWTLLNTGWAFTDQTYTMKASPAVNSPVPGSTLPSTTVTFTGDHDSADLQHWLYVGTSQGAFNLFNQDLGAGHTATVSGLPSGGTIWVRYWTRFSSGWFFTDQSYTMITPPIISPSPGSTLTSTTVTFTGGHSPVDLQHWLYVGTTAGSNNVFDQDLGTGHAATVGGLPNFGTIWVTYWTRLSSGWQSTVQQYSMNAVPAGPIVSPAPGSALTDSAVTFTGSHSSTDLQHWLFVGTFPGRGDVFDEDLGTGHTATVAGLPTHPSVTIWVRYFTRSSWGWYFTDQSYTPSAATPKITSPVPGSTLTSTSAQFTGGHFYADLQHRLDVGTTQGATNLFSQDLGTIHVGTTVSGLPTTGTVWVRYWTRLSSGWVFTDQSYTMNVGPPAIVSRVPGTSLQGRTVTFTGEHTGADLQHRLSIGFTQGSSELFDEDLGTGHTTATVSGLPDHAVIWVRYWTRFSSGWVFTDQSYTTDVRAAFAQGGSNDAYTPPIRSPEPGSKLPSSVVAFTGDHTSDDIQNVPGLSQHWLSVGTTQGGTDLADQDMGNGHTAIVSGLPSGATIWVRYWTRFRGGIAGFHWEFIDHLYIGGP